MANTYLTDDLKALGINPAQAGYFPIACRTGICYVNGTANGSQQATCRVRHILPFGSVDVIPVYAGWKSAPAEQSMAWPAGAHVGIERRWGVQADWGTVGNAEQVLRRATASSSTELQVPTDDLLLTDPVSVNAPSGTAIGTRIWLPVSTVSFSRVKQPNLNEYSNIATTIVDVSWGGTPFANTGGLSAMIQPIVILGRAVDGMKHPSIALVGDSNTFGTVSLVGGSTGYDSTDADGNCGMFERSLASAIPFSSFGAPGDELAYWLDKTATGSARRTSRMRALHRFGYTHILMALSGTNDIGAGKTLAQVQDLWRNMVDEMLGTGAEVWASTPLPRTTSTDVWATNGNQTLGSIGTITQQMADWIRASSATYGVKRVIDINALANPDNSGLWRTDLNGTFGTPPTYDGLHPSQAMISWLGSHSTLTAEAFQ